MNARHHWSRLLTVIGGVGLVLGALDPLEGSLVILPSTALVALGTFLSDVHRRWFRYWIGLLLLVTVGVGGLFLLSALGGIGGTSGPSMWWGILILPYPVGWLLGMVNLLFRLIANKERRHASA